MPIHNSDVASTFNQIADLLSIKGANQFRIRAYRDAARTVGELSKDLTGMVRAGDDLTGIQGIGKDLAAKIKELVQTGTLGYLDELKAEVPVDLIELLKISGLGPRKVAAVHEKLGVNTLGELKEAARNRKIRELEGFGPKTEQNISEEIKRLKLMVADEIALPLCDYLKKIDGVKEVEIAGSYRRRQETVGDLDILVTHRKGAEVMAAFVAYDEVQKIVLQGRTRTTVLLKSGVQVDLRAVAQASYGAALHYFTGSKAHNIAVRKMGVKKHLKINEYGVFKGKKRVAGRSEEEVYRQVGLPYIPPELRENRGEIEAARNGELPALIEPEDIRGDLHAHTRRTDGHATLEEMARAAAELGYEYLAITEHSKQVTVAGGLTADELRDHLREIERVNEKLGEPLLLKGVEVDILEDGSLDLDDDILQELDFTVCSIHSRFNLSREKQTERIIRAMDNPFFRILGHPSGRLINERPPYEVDLEKVIRAAAEKNRFLELNAHPDRLDLSDVYLKLARELGVKIAVSTDAHSVESLHFMRFGVWQARRGWLEAEDVLNTRPWRELKKIFNRR